MRGRRKVICGFILHGVTGHNRVAMVRSGGRIAQGCITLVVIYNAQHGPLVYL